MAEPLVSICIPSYQRARYLPEALESALSQSHPNVEIVVADDGSTDGSLDIAYDYQRRSSRPFRVVTHEDGKNHGIAATTNLAVEESRGDYLWFFACDDVLLPRAIERHVEVMSSDPRVGLVAGYGYHIDAEGRRLGGAQGRDLSVVDDPLFFFLQAFPVIGASLLVRREAYLRVHPQKDMVCSDWEVFVRLVALTSVGFCRTPVVKYRLHGANISRGISAVEEARRALEVMTALRSANHREGGLALPRYQALVELRLADLRFVLGCLDHANEHLQRAFELWPRLAEEPRNLGRWLAPRFNSQTPTREGKLSFSEWCRPQLERHAGARAARTAWRRAKAVRKRSELVHGLRHGRWWSAARSLLLALRWDPQFILELILLGARRLRGISRPGALHF